MSLATELGRSRFIRCLAFSPFMASCGRPSLSSSASWCRYGAGCDCRAAAEQVGEDILPLFLLFANRGDAHCQLFLDERLRLRFLAILHAKLPVFTLLWLPFGKFFHIFQRSATVGVAFYQDVGKQGEQAKCRRCGDEFASRMHVEDLIAVEQQLGYRYEMPDSPVEHYQWICPRCRRALLGLALGSQLWAGVRDRESSPGNRNQKSKERSQESGNRNQESATERFRLLISDP